MFGTILLAVDGSPHSEKAADLAARLALAGDDTVVAVQVLERPAGFPGTLGIDPPEDLGGMLASYAEKLEAAGVKVDTDLRSSLVGHVATTLVEAAKEHDAGLIVMGSRGRSDLTALLLGTVAHKVLHLSDRPVLIAR
jgi:nucleotide-binding universal stress UspA family protein